MNLITEPYPVQTERWPQTGRHILAQYDAEKIVVYQAYPPEIGRYAAEHGCFGGAFSQTRMSWIKPNFLWMTYRCGWATKKDQETVLAVSLRREAFDAILAEAVPSTFFPGRYRSELSGSKRSRSPSCVCSGTPIIILQEQSWSAERSNLACAGTFWPATPASGSSALRTSPTLSQNRV